MAVRCRLTSQFSGRIAASGGHSSQKVLDTCLLTEDIDEDENGWGTAWGCVVLWATGGAWSPGLVVSPAVSHWLCQPGQLFHPEALFSDL